jgi:hypothetical protein
MGCRLSTRGSIATRLDLFDARASLTPSPPCQTWFPDDKTTPAPPKERRTGAGTFDSFKSQAPHDHRDAPRFGVCTEHLCLPQIGIACLLHIDRPGVESRRGLASLGGLPCQVYGAHPRVCGERLCVSRIVQSASTYELPLKDRSKLDGRSDYEPPNSRSQHSWQNIPLRGDTKAQRPGSLPARIPSPSKSV